MTNDHLLIDQLNEQLKSLRSLKKKLFQNVTYINASCNAIPKTLRTTYALNRQLLSSKDPLNKKHSIELSDEITNVAQSMANFISSFQHN